MNKLSTLFISKLCFFILTFFFIHFHSWAQSNVQSQKTIVGKTVDSLTQKALYGASATLIHQKDSIIHQFVWTQNTGQFQLKGIKPGKYILLIAYPGYADFTDDISIDSSFTSKDYGSIKLKSKADLLREVVIKGEYAMMKMNGDTVEFDPRAFKVEANANIEELLKQIPGLEIDAKGNITAYGQSVQKVLIEGEEFFGDDPTLVTRNLRADMVAKIQLFDKQSKFSEQTGVKDGVTTKTINIKLKEDKKKGVFGNLVAAQGNESYNQKQGMLNYFNKDFKVAGFGFYSNTNRTNITDSDRSRFNFSSEASNYFTNSTLHSLVQSMGDSPLTSSYGGQGFPTSTSAGFHIEDRFFDRKHKGSADYFFNQFNLDKLSSTWTKNPLDNALINQFDQLGSKSALDAHRLKINYDVKIDSLSNLEIRTNFSKVDNEFRNSQESSIQSDIDGNLLRSDRQLIDQANIQDIGVKIDYSKRFKKPQRSFGFGFNLYDYQHTGDAYLNAVIDFDNNVPNNVTSQWKDIEKAGKFLGARVQFTEPLTKYLTSRASYSHIWTKGDIINKSFNRDANGEFTQLDREFSNQFQLDERLQLLNTGLIFNKSKWNVNLNISYINMQLDQIDQLTGDEFNRNVDFLISNVSVSKNFEKQGSIRFSLDNIPQVPTIDQVQPIRNNINPQQIRLGNDLLRPAMQRNLSMNFNKSIPLKNIYYSVAITYNVTENPIVSDVQYENNGLSTLKYVNLSEHAISRWSLSWNFGHAIKLSSSHRVGYSLTPAFNTGVHYSMINTQIIKQQVQDYSTRAELSYGATNRVSLSYSFTPRYMKNTSSNNSQFDNSEFSFSQLLVFNVSAVKNYIFQITTNQNYRPSTRLFPDPLDIKLVHLNVARDFFKNKQLRAMLTINDLFNQYVGFSRSANAGYLVEQRFNVIGRYGLLSLTWNFNKFGKSKE